MKAIYQIFIVPKHADSLITFSNALKYNFCKINCMHEVKSNKQTLKRLKKIK